MNNRLFKEFEKLINEGVCFELHKDMPNGKTLYLKSSELLKLISLQEDLNYRNRGLTEEFIKEYKDRAYDKYKEIVENKDVDLEFEKINNAEEALIFAKFENICNGDGDIKVIYYSDKLIDLSYLKEIPDDNVDKL